MDQRDECAGCRFCGKPESVEGHAFRKRERTGDRRKRSAGRRRQENRRKDDAMRYGRCDCWACQPGRVKRRVLLKRAVALERRSGN